MPQAILFSYLHFVRNVLIMCANIRSSVWTNLRKLNITKIVTGNLLLVLKLFKHSLFTYITEVQFTFLVIRTEEELNIIRIWLSSPQHNWKIYLFNVYYVLDDALLMTWHISLTKPWRLIVVPNLLHSRCLI